LQAVVMLVNLLRYLVNTRQCGDKSRAGDHHESTDDPGSDLFTKARFQGVRDSSRTSSKGLDAGKMP